MSFSNIVNKFHNKNSFPYTSTTKEPNLSTSLIWCKKIDNLENIARKKDMINVNTEIG